MRGGKATLPLTIPVAYLSRAKDSTRRSMEIVLQAVTAALPSRRLNQRPRALGAKGPYCGSASGRRAHASLLAGFDLEALSHNPAHVIGRVKLTLSHGGLNPTHVPYWWVNNPTLGELRFTMIGRADIEGSKAASL
ncbi:hypothetical protein H5410_064030 [Solanum commersonii]|uniref:Uncharacterized protein n=1 Tax=Solanum commersonii TaxID=4109 RepID=A0A9J5W0P7_SOLCO|nr:hypothetical protein H5410_064030 [Solanum commersonii]